MSYIEEINDSQQGIAASFPVKFTSQKQAKDWFRQQFTEQAKNKKSFSEGPEYDLLLNILKCHSCVGRKFYCGDPVSFALEYDAGIRVYIELPNGEFDDFSWLECMENIARMQKGKLPKREEDNRHRDVRTAMRNAIQYQIESYRRDIVEKGEGYKSALTGEMLDPNNTHVDHEIPFEEIASEWIESQGGEWNVKIEDAQASHRGFILSDKDQKESWCKFHEEKAKLRILSHWENLSTVRKKREK